MDDNSLKERCLEALKVATTVTDFAELIGYRRGGLHKRTLLRLSLLCGQDIKETLKKNKEREVPDKTCKFCGNIFKHKYSRYSSGNFCSRECAKKFAAKAANTPELIARKRQFMREHPRLGLKELRETEEFQKNWRKKLREKYPLKIWVCPVCGKELQLTEKQAAKRKYCSGTCRNIALNKFKYGQVSRAEKLLRESLEKNFPTLDIVYNDRQTLGGLELDLYIPSLKYAVEWNGIYHYKDIGGKLNKIQEKDLAKQKLCTEKGIVLRVIKDLKSDKKTILEGIDVVVQDILNLGV